MKTPFYPGSPWRRGLAAASAVVVAVCLSLAAAYLTRNYERSRLAAEFGLLAQNRAMLVQQEIDRCLELLDAIGGFYDATDKVTRLRFSAFVQGAMVGVSGVQALEFIPRVQGGRRDAFEESVRAEGFPEFSITERDASGTMRPADARLEYFPVYFVEPFKGNEAALGYDLASNPVRREALTLAMDTASPVATGRIVLVQEKRSQYGFLLFRPIYRQGAPAGTSEQRRAALEGFALGVFRVEDLAESALRRSRPEAMDCEFFDAAAPGTESSLYFHASRTRGREPSPEALPAASREPGAPTNVFHADIALAAPGRQWVMRCTAAPAFLAGRTGATPWMVLASGLTMSLLLALYLRRGLKALLLTEAHAAERAEAARTLGEKMEMLEKAHYEAMENEEILQKILLGIRAGIIVIDPADFRILEVNSVAEEIVGVGRGELVGKFWRAIDWRDKTGAALAEGGFTENKNWLEEELRIVHPDGRAVPVIKTLVNGYRGGKFLAFEIVFDISERKALERQLATAQKLESIGLLAAGIAHEINTPTQYIGDNLHFLHTAFDDLTRLFVQADRLAEAGEADREAAVRDYRATREAIDPEFLGQEIPKALSQSRDGVERVSVIVKAMKKFSHPGSGEKSAVDINEAVENTIVVARNEWKYVAEVQTDLDRELPPVYCLPGDFNQVVLNILVNAAHAVAAKVEGAGDKGRILVSTSRDDGYLRLDIADNGAGIPEENRGKIFDPFFTTKEVGKGTGQGLAIAHQIIVEKHGGSIDFQSEVGIGTTFTIRIPFGEAKASRERQ